MKWISCLHQSHIETGELMAASSPGGSESVTSEVERKLIGHTLYIWHLLILFVL